MSTEKVLQGNKRRLGRFQLTLTHSEPPGNHFLAITPVAIQFPDNFPAIGWWDRVSELCTTKTPEALLRVTDHRNTLIGIFESQRQLKSGEPLPGRHLLAYAAEVAAFRTINTLIGSFSPRYETPDGANAKAQEDLRGLRKIMTPSMGDDPDNGTPPLLSCAHPKNELARCTDQLLGLVAESSNISLNGVVRELTSGPIAATEVIQAAEKANTVRVITDTALQILNNYNLLCQAIASTLARGNELAAVNLGAVLSAYTKIPELIEPLMNITGWNLPEKAIASFQYFSNLANKHPKVTPILMFLARGADNDYWQGQVIGITQVNLPKKLASEKTGTAELKQLASCLGLTNRKKTFDPDTLPIDKNCYVKGIEFGNSPLTITVTVGSCFPIETNDSESPAIATRFIQLYIDLRKNTFDWNLLQAPNTRSAQCLFGHVRALMPDVLETVYAGLDNRTANSLSDMLTAKRGVKPAPRGKQVLRELRNPSGGGGGHITVEPGFRIPEKTRAISNVTGSMFDRIVPVEPIDPLLGHLTLQEPQEVRIILKKLNEKKGRLFLLGKHDDLGRRLFSYAANRRLDGRLIFAENPDGFLVLYRAATHDDLSKMGIYDKK